MATIRKDLINIAEGNHITLAELEYLSKDVIIIFEYLDIEQVSAIDVVNKKGRSLFVQLNSTSL